MQAGEILFRKVLPRLASDRAKIRFVRNECNGYLRLFAGFEDVVQNCEMVQIVYLSSNESMPDRRVDEPWLTVEASHDGRFLGTGASWTKTGEWVGYRSLVDDDVSLEAALAAAEQWASKYSVPTIWVQTTP